MHRHVQNHTAHHCVSALWAIHGRFCMGLAEIAQKCVPWPSVCATAPRTRSNSLDLFCFRFAMGHGAPLQWLVHTPVGAAISRPDELQPPCRSGGAAGPTRGRSPPRPWWGRRVLSCLVSAELGLKRSSRAPGPVLWTTLMSKGPTIMESSDASIRMAPDWKSYLAKLAFSTCLAPLRKTPDGVPACAKLHVVILN